jgi:thioredoxin-dependent peroxiredoxin
LISNLFHFLEENAMKFSKRFALALSALVLALGGVWTGGMANAQDDKVSLKVGDAAPVFESVDDQGKTWKSTDYVGKKVVVVYFYPADLTGGCTKQACGFRDDMKTLTDKGVVVVGVSGDSVKNHQIFKAVHKLNFTLLADEKANVAKKFGVPFTPFKPGDKTVKAKDQNGEPVELVRGCTIQRWTFVIGMDGKILMKNSKVAAAEDSQKILELLSK